MELRLLPLLRDVEAEHQRVFNYVPDASEGGLPQAVLEIRDEFQSEASWCDPELSVLMEVGEQLIWCAVTADPQSHIPAYMRLCAYQRWLYFRDMLRKDDAELTYELMLEAAEEQGVDPELLPTEYFDGEMLDFDWDQLAALDRVLKVMYLPVPTEEVVQP